MKSEILIEIQCSTIKRYASEDLEFPTTAPVFYNKGIVDVGNIQTALSEQYYGTSQINAVTFTLDDSNGEIRTLIDSEEVRDMEVIIKKVDLDDNSIKQTLTVKISTIDLKVNTATFSTELKELDVWSEDVPRKKTTTEEFPGIGKSDIPYPNYEGTIPESLDIPIGTWFGYCKKVPLIYILQDRVSDYYDYLIGFGPIVSVNNVYRSGVYVTPSEYTVYKGDNPADPYPGYAFIRFIKEQRDYSYNLYPLSADISGLNIGGILERNPAKVWKEWLINAIWGLGLIVNDVSFAAAAARCDNLGLKLDGGFNVSKSALEWNKEFVFATRLGQLIKNEDGEYELNIPIYEDSTLGAFDEHNCTIESDKKTPSTNCVKNITINYQLDYSQNKFLKTNEKDTGFSFGSDREYNLEFVREDLTASRIAQYLRNRFLHSERTIKITTGLDFQELKEGDRITLTHSICGLNLFKLELTEVSKSRNVVELTGQEYNSSIFDYTIETYNNDPPDTEPDYSKTTPDLIKNLMMISSTGLSSDGTINSWFTITFDPPTTYSDAEGNVANFQQGLIYLLKQGVGEVWQQIGASSDGTFKSPSVVPGYYYRCKVVSQNTSGLLSNAVESGWVMAAGDTSAPAKPTGLTAAGKMGSCLLKWTKNTETDLKVYYIYRNSVKISEIASISYIDQDVVVGVTYSYQVSAVDFTGNESTKSTAASATPTSFSPGDADICLQEWLYTGTFSAVDNDTIQWTAGQLKISGGTIYNISAGSVDIPGAGTIYVYLDTEKLPKPTTVFQTSVTWSQAAGAGKVFIARGIYNAVLTSLASIICQGNLKGNVTTADIVVNTIVAGHIQVGIITSDKIQTGTIEAIKIKSYDITATQIATGTLDARTIKSNAIETNKIKANAVTADKINVTTLSAITANCGTITAGVIQSSDGTLKIDLAAKTIGVSGSASIWVWGGSLTIAASGELTVSGSTVTLSGSSSIDIRTGGRVSIQSGAYIDIEATDGVRFIGDTGLKFDIARLVKNSNNINLIPTATNKIVSLGVGVSRWGTIGMFASDFVVDVSDDIELITVSNLTGSQIIMTLPVAATGAGVKNTYRLWRRWDGYILGEPA